MGTTGVISIQGDFSKHLEVLSRIGAQAKEIREPRDLAGVDRVILPGGESTTVGMLLERYGLAAAIRLGLPTPLARRRGRRSEMRRTMARAALVVSLVG